jgi:hypothetical protein
MIERLTPNPGPSNQMYAPFIDEAVSSYLHNERLVSPGLELPASRLVGDDRPSWRHQRHTHSRGDDDWRRASPRELVAAFAALAALIGGGIASLVLGR